MFTLNCRGRLLTIDKPIVMGIINTTPDSFFKESRSQNIEELIVSVDKMIKDGAKILDLGGQSTRPGSEHISSQEEAGRVIPAIEAIAQNFPDIFISIDTFYADVAKHAVFAGASIINDISGGLLDDKMLATAAELKTPFICMHMKGTPQTMQQLATYDDVTREVLDFFIDRLEQCRLAGITDVVIDPGIGFSKTYAHNFELIKNLQAFKMLQKPLLLGVSRKGTIYKTLGITAEEALNGTTVLNTVGLLNGANILRVHDVKEAMEAITLVEKIKQ